MAADLVFFEEIRVGEPVLAPRSVRAEVRFTPRRGRPFRQTLRFVYDRPVLRDDARTRNWARILCAVPPLNYALFARRLVLDGALASPDLAWLRASLDVTAREQLLNRFVGEHPLILPAYRIPESGFRPAMVERVAAIEAPRDRFRLERPAAAAGGHAVLSSGGKESLLTYGVLREAGLPVHALFLNESGRHWHTALTAHRHLSAKDPRTRRVWTDVDRFYVATNRRVPAVRPDFQRVKADVYPLQLFTFHVYQLAAMPVLWADGVGHLWMGNEFDEGPWPEVNGVRHWNAIHDQSQEFDRAASRFYEQKGWGVRQASLVRSMSGPAIQAMLAKRYADLFALQVSCHATTIRDGKVLPCGTCSKCAGILLFLLAAGADPARIRYRREHVAQLPQAVAATRLKLDSSEAEHCLGKLVARGWPFAGSANGFAPRARPEVGKLRFDAEMSRLDNLTPEVAEKVYPLLLAHADGAVRREGDRWRELPERFWAKAAGKVLT